LHKPFTEEVLIRKAREVLDGGRKPLFVQSDVAELVTAPGALDDRRS
jgi:hypothetical protein